jgi:hypothetical protein
MKFRFTSRLLLFVSLLLITKNQVAAQVKDSRPIIGRWDLTVQMDRVAPSWLEVKLSGLKTLVGYFVAEGGSARPIAEVKYDNGKVSFSIPTQWDMSNNPMVFEGMLQNDQLSGTITTPKGDKYPFTGERAPLLKRTSAPVWGAPIALFNGKDLNDSGRYLFTKNKADIGKFKTPGLRNVAITAPYMHNGMFATLEEVVDYYNDPLKKIPDAIDIDTALQKPLGLTNQEKKDLVAFLKTLTDKRFEQHK